MSGENAIRMKKKSEKKCRKKPKNYSIVIHGVRIIGFSSPRTIFDSSLIRGNTVRAQAPYDTEEEKERGED